MSFSQRFLDEIRARIGLADRIARKVKLTKRGREFSGLCPFHNEKTPSFTVNEDKGFFHCFGCGAHGDVIGFVMRTENSSFPEVVERLAEEAGLEVPVSSPEE
ncbi:MAG: CHC2 zinc finger domain-containing protein, partial [Alphaproteobacteria bacterium]